jgi:hypothetical protein
MKLIDFLIIAVITIVVLMWGGCLPECKSTAYNCLGIGAGQIYKEVSTGFNEGVK